MINNEVKDKKKFNMKGQNGKQKMSIYKSFKSNIDGLEEPVNKSGAIKHAAQFTKALEEIANYIQKSITVVAKVIKDAEHPTLIFQSALCLRQL